MPIAPVDGTINGTLAGLPTVNGALASVQEVGGALSNAGNREYHESDIFYASYNVTTSAEIAEALEADKEVIAVRDGMLYQYAFNNTNGNGYCFYANCAGGLYEIYCKDDRWSHSFIQLAPSGLINTKANKVALASEFSTSVNYHVGDYCWYNHYIYRFVADHPHGAWSQNDVVEVKLADEIHSIPAGGSTGDIMIKQSNADYDGAWVAPANAVEQDNTLPITSAAVYTEIGNINALLATI